MFVFDLKISYHSGRTEAEYRHVWTWTPRSVPIYCRYFVQVSPVLEPGQDKGELKEYVFSRNTPPRWSSSLSSRQKAGYCDAVK